MALPVTVEGSYDLQVEFTRTMGQRGLGIAFPVGSPLGKFVFGGWGGKVSGLDYLDGRRARDNVTTKPANLISNHRYQILIKVRPAGESINIEILLDGAPYLRWQGRQASLMYPILQDWPRRQPVLGPIWSSGHTLTFHSASIQLVAGRAFLLPR